MASVAMVPLAGTGMRHLFPVAPLAFVLAADGFARMTRPPGRRGLGTLVVFGFILHSLTAAAS